METEMVALLKSIEAAVNGGKAVISADNSIIIAMMQETLKHGRSATFYVSPAQGRAVMRWYWTPRANQRNRDGGGIEGRKGQN
jgi:hypothetical protein